MQAFTSGSIVELRSDFCDDETHPFTSFAAYSPPKPQDPTTKPRRPLKLPSKPKHCENNGENDVLC